MIPLSESEKKLLTEFLDEYWHEITLSFNDGMVSKCSCGARGGIARMECPKNNHTFTTWQDLGDLRNRLDELDRLSDFIEFAYRKIECEIRRSRRGIRNQTVDKIDGPIELQVPEYILNPAVFIPLVVEFLKEAKHG
jgi:hypothetical protein